MIKHLAVVMDGNRRWAASKDLLPWLGHQKGTDTIRNLIDFCLESKISIASIYTFSLENFKRPQSEVDYIFDLIIEQASKILPNLIKHQICIRFCGDRNYFPEYVKPSIEKLEEITKDFTNLILVVYFCYGGQQEIISAIKSIANDVKLGILEPEQINQKLFDNYLWSSGLPEPELIIRTGGANRLSNFLLFKAAYSEFYFTDILWPELTKQDLAEALNVFLTRKRNFGF